MIDSNQISVVIQGPVYGTKDDIENDKITKRCCERVRKLLPEAEIILSTWKGSDVDELTYDVVIFNDDPGEIMMRLDGVDRMNNTNRMLVSTHNGIKKASRKYTIKMRSDMWIENLCFLEKFGEYPIEEKNSIMGQRIIVLPSTCPYRGKKILFAMQDWFNFGLTTDLEKLWNVPLQKKEDLIYKNGVADFDDNLVAENYIWVDFLNKDGYFHSKLGRYKGKIPYNKENLGLYELSLAKYSVLYDGKTLGLNSLKYPNQNYVRKDFAKASCYMHFEWQKMYKRYFDKSMKIDLAIRDRIDIIKYIITFHIIQRRFNKIYNFLRGRYNTHGQ